LEGTKRFKIDQKKKKKRFEIIAQLQQELDRSVSYSEPINYLLQKHTNILQQKDISLIY
jgi:hypothetical protein